MSSPYLYSASDSELRWIYIHMKITRMWLNRLPVQKLVKSNCRVYNHLQFLPFVIGHISVSICYNIQQLISVQRWTMRMSGLNVADFLILTPIHYFMRGYIHFRSKIIYSFVSHHSWCYIFNDIHWIRCYFTLKLRQKGKH